MTEQAKKILEQIQNLSEKERKELIDSLLAPKSRRRKKSIFKTRDCP